MHQQIVITLCLLIRNAPHLPEQIWGYFPKLMSLFEFYTQEPCGMTYIDPIILCFCNFMQKDSETFVNQQMGSGKTPLDAVFHFISMLIEEGKERQNEGFLERAMLLLVAMLENLKGKIDNFIEPIISVCLDHLSMGLNSRSTFIILQTLALCFFYSAEKTFQVLDSKSATMNFFSLWFE